MSIQVPQKAPRRFHAIYKIPMANIFRTRNDDKIRYEFETASKKPIS